MGSRPTPTTTLAALALLASTYALETPVTAAKLQWRQPVRQTTVALLTETEDAMQSAHAMWPVAVAMNDMLDGVGGDSVIAALPFATGAECRTFGLRRYVRWRQRRQARGEGRRLPRRGRGALRADGVPRHRAPVRGAIRRRRAARRRRVARGLREGASLDAGSVADLAAALKLPAAAVVFAGKTETGSLVVECADADALRTAARPSDLRGAKRWLLTAAESDDAFASRAFLDDASDDGLTPAACALALFWAARRDRPLDRPAALAHDGAALSLVLVPPKAPKFGGRKRKHVSRLPSVTVTLAP
ncbi:hypothetical protein JL722_1534 [Aureococcus anophagefferens]|nr:hypothetical protein JL722_1534 [Aureococcus anophagefferens]